MDNTHIRWHQRFSSYKKALLKLEEAVTSIQQRYIPDEKGVISSDVFLDDIIKEGVIQRFEYTHELAWKVMKDFILHSGNEGIYGSKDATREAFSLGLIENGDVWMDMIKSRNLTSHIYNESAADEIFQKVIKDYFAEMHIFCEKMEELISADNTNNQ